MYLVKLENGGFTWYLIRSTWTTEIERASRFESLEAAKVAFEKQRKFLKASLARRVDIYFDPRVG